MQTILNVIVPIFVLIAAGYGAGRSKLLGVATGEALTAFVFTIALPTLLFRTLATVSIGQASPIFLWLSYFGGVAVTWAAASLLVRWLLRRDWRTSTIGGVSASFANTVFIAIPAVERAYGRDGLTPLFLVIAIHLPVMMIASTLLMQAAASRDGSAAGKPAGGATLAGILRRVVASLGRNPIVGGIIAGLLWRLTGAPLPLMLDEVTRLVGDTAGPLALFALGMSLVRYGIEGDVLAALLISALSLGLMPAAVYAIGIDLLPASWLKAAVLTAACPAGVNAYMLAAHFGSGEKLASTTILVSTLLSVLTLSLWLTLLG